MKQILRIICLFFSCVFILGLSSCGFNEDLNEKILYDISNQYFSQASFEKNKLTNIGVNGHQGSGTNYEVLISTKCYVSLIQFTANVKLYSTDDMLLEEFDKTVEKDLSAKVEISFTKSITYETYQKLDRVVVSWNGKSYENPDEVEITPLIPIKYIDLSNRDTSMCIGESICLNYELVPENTDEGVIINCGDSSIIELDGNKITAKNIGETWISVKPSNSKSNTYLTTINIKVVEPLDYNDFKTKYKHNLEKATVSVFCKRYNKNWLGKEKDTYIVSGYGTIIKSVAFADYFLTDKTIFDTVNNKYDYEEWYVTDYLGKEYSISGIQYHKTAQIAIGSFTSSTSYPIAPVYDSYPYEGDYVISLIGNPLTSRISETGYFALSSSGTRSYVFYHDAGLRVENRGEAIYNSKGEIIGISLMLLDKRVISVSSIAIRELMKGVFD